VRNVALLGIMLALLVAATSCSGPAAPRVVPFHEAATSSSELAAPPAAPVAAPFREDFGDYPVGRWREGSVHGLWFVSYDSSPCGRVGIVRLSSGRKVYRADLSRCRSLRATKTITRASYPTNITVTWRFRVVRKTLKVKKDWHTAWLGLAHTTDNAWNTLLLKRGVQGWEAGKFSPKCPEGGSNRNQCYFGAAKRPQFADGRWHTGRIVQRGIPGGVAMTVYGDGRKVGTLRDTRRAPNTVGNVLLYNEGSIVDFAGVRVSLASR
jgi:hypothetical protein